MLYVELQLLKQPEPKLGVGLGFVSHSHCGKLSRGNAVETG